MKKVLIGVDPIGYPEWPTVARDFEQRYSDVGPARLSMLSSAGFVAAKTSAWLDRAEARDVYDLWALAEAGYIDAGAVRVHAHRRNRQGPGSSRRTSFGCCVEPEARTAVPDRG